MAADIVAGVREHLEHRPTPPTSADITEAALATVALPPKAAPLPPSPPDAIDHLAHAPTTHPRRATHARAVDTAGAPGEDGPLFNEEREDVSTALAETEGTPVEQFAADPDVDGTDVRTQPGQNARTFGQSNTPPARISPGATGRNPDVMPGTLPGSVPAGTFDARELSLAEAAKALGKAPDTVRRLVRQGKLPGRLDASRRLWVTVPAEAERPQTGEDVSHLRELLTIREEQVRVLTAELDSRRHEAQAAEQAAAEMRRLLGEALTARRLHNPAEYVDADSAEATPSPDSPPRKRRWWQR